MAAFSMLNVCACIECDKEPLKMTATLTPDPAAVQPVIPSSLTSKAYARLTLWPNNTMQLNIVWNLDNIRDTNPIIGIHIHDGSHSENGGILYGFCGGGSLPAFGFPKGPCAQYSEGSFVYIGSPCALGHPPCVTTCEQTPGKNTPASAADYLRKHWPYRKNFYINLHTELSFQSTEKDGKDSKAWGLIRGQLVDEVTTTTTTTMPMEPCWCPSHQACRCGDHWCRKDFFNCPTYCPKGPRCRDDLEFESTETNGQSSGLLMLANDGNTTTPIQTTTTTTTSSASAVAPTKTKFLGR
jgi:hypothetical protein